MTNSPVITSADLTIAPTGRLAGSRVVIIGGARGIGAEIAGRLVADGAQIVILDRLVDEGSARAAQLGGEFLEVDLSDAGSTATATSAALGLLGGVDILINNAGILRKAALLDITVEEWDAVFAVNTRSMLVTIQVVGRAMRDAGTPGKIINLASMAGKTGGAGQAHYAASKSAVIALTRVAALELGIHGITVNCICPGYVLTDMGEATRTEADVAQWSTYSPLGRLGQTSDIAGVAAFLASPDADYLTGQAINVCGGMNMA